MWGVGGGGWRCRACCFFVDLFVFYSCSMHLAFNAQSAMAVISGRRLRELSGFCGR